jgi:hypothetical protein
MAVTRHSSRKPKARKLVLSDHTKKTLLIGTGSTLVVVGCCWAWFTFTTISPPDLKAAEPQKVVDFLGSSRGFPRMSVDGRERFLTQMWSRFSEGENREKLARSFEQMSSAERQAFVDAAFDTVKVRFLEQATEYNKLPKHKKTDFVDNMIRNIDTQRRSVGGYGGGGNVLKSFEGSVPHTTDGMTKMLVERTSATQRTKAQPLFDDIAARYQEGQANKRKVSGMP